VPGKALVHGQSITDGCLGWEESVEVLERLAAAVETRREGFSGASGPGASRQREA
jgi:3-deoxy-7-phosphoheptulonate synthase